MSAFQCPSCDGRFPRPAERDDERPQCPWCGEVGEVDMAEEVVVRTRVRERTEGRDEQSNGILGGDFMEKFR